MPRRSALTHPPIAGQYANLSILDVADSTERHNL